MALSLQSKVDTGRIGPSRGRVAEARSHPLLPAVNMAPGEVTHKDNVLPHYQFSPRGKPLPGLLISCVKTTHEVTPAQSLIGSMGQQLFICTTAFRMTG